jgi:hypothetical protein
VEDIAEQIVPLLPSLEHVLIRNFTGKEWHTFYWVIDASHARKEDVQVGQEVMGAVGLGSDY